MYKKLLIIFSFAILTQLSFARFYNGRFKPSKVGETQEIFEQNELISVGWAEMKVNNFGANGTWQNRYLVNTQYYEGESSSPIFLMLRGENTLSAPFMTAGAWVEYAAKFNALLFQLEHRFYGQSMPTYDLKIESLQYLTVDQALADIANFIQQMNAKYDIHPTQKWIIFGGSYAGALATWAVEKYPKLAYGAVASSGTVNAVMNFGNFFSAIHYTISSLSNDCANEIQNGFNILQTMINNPVGQRQLEYIFPLAGKLENSNKYDKINLMASISNNFADVVQLNGINTIGNTVTIPMICEIMTNEQLGTPLQRIVAVTKAVLQEHNEKEIYFDYEIMVKQLAATSIESPVATGGFRQWLYQMCTQMGFFQTTDNKPYIFGKMIPMEFFFNQCGQVFGPTINQTYMTNGIQKNNVKHGGLLPLVKNVISLQGSYDPWHEVGITKTIPNRVQAVLIPGTAHCADLYASSPNDLPQLTAARQTVVQFLTKLLVNTSESKASSSNNMFENGSSIEEIGDNNSGNGDVAKNSIISNNIHSSFENTFDNNLLHSFNISELLSI